MYFNSYLETYNHCRSVHSRCIEEDFRHCSLQVCRHHLERFRCRWSIALTCCSTQQVPDLDRVAMLQCNNELATFVMNNSAWFAFCSRVGAPPPAAPGYSKKISQNTQVTCRWPNYQLLIVCIVKNWYYELLTWWICCHHVFYKTKL